MKKQATTTPGESAQTDTTPPPAVIVRVRVIKNGLSIAGCVAAKNAQLNCTEAAAKFHEERGEVQILGTL